MFKLNTNINLVSAYENYYKNPSKINLKILIKTIISYDFQNYLEEIEIIFNKKSLFAKNEKFEILRSNGSSNNGVSRFFEFGPNCYDCIRLVEKILRDNKNRTICITSLNFGKHKIKFSIKKEINHQMNISVAGNWSKDLDIKKLINLLDREYKKYGKINILAWPNALLCLFTNKQFKIWLEKNKHKINAVINSDWEFFLKIKDIYIRDQMIDWSSGLNFYKCKNQTLHFLPIFFLKNEKIYNLLNFNKNLIRKKQDLVTIKNKIEKCECGKNYLKIDIISQYKNKIKNEKEIINFNNFYDNLKNNYFNLQIYQNIKNEITILYSCKENELKDDHIEMVNFFNKNNINNISFVKDKYFQIGRKRYSFWRSKNKIEILDFKV